MGGDGGANISLINHVIQTTELVNHLDDLVCPVKVWLGKLTALSMTPLG